MVKGATDPFTVCKTCLFFQSFPQSCLAATQQNLNWFGLNDSGTMLTMMFWEQHQHDNIRLCVLSQSLGVITAGRLTIN